MKPRL